uniref:CYP97B7 n=1 Tax=Arundo donax TaxID=35708 RepID=A0A0A9G3K8_ARUDO
MFVQVCAGECMPHLHLNVKQIDMRVDLVPLGPNATIDAAMYMFLIRCSWSCFAYLKA